MPALTIVKVLWCGQGMTTLVEIYADGHEKDVADYLVLVDCGGNVEWGGRAVNYVAQKVLDKRDNILDAVVISHQDQDHVILLKQLGDKLRGQATIGSVFLGGLEWKQSNQKVVKDFLDALDVDPKGVVFDAPKLSHYTGAKTVDKLRYWVNWNNEVYIRAMVSGLVTTGRPDIRKNASSAVVVVDNGSLAVVLPGDATYQTMDAVNEIKNIGTLLRPVLGLEIPHHGALRTAVEEYVANKDPTRFNYEIIDEFARIVSPRYVAASAGPWNTHHHPIEEVLERFDPHLQATTEHTYVSYIFSRPDGVKHEGWTEFSDVTYTEWCTVFAIGETAKKSKSKFRAVKKEGVNKGPFVFGDISFKLGGAVALAPEEMVSFHPLGTIGPDPADEPVYFAPAP